MMARLAFLLRMIVSVAIATAGALALLAIAVLTAFQARRFYREGVASRLGRAILAVWGIRLVRHGAWPVDLPGQPVAQRVYVSNHTSTIDLFALLALGLPNTRFFLSGYLRALPPFAIIGWIIGIFWTVPQTRTEDRRRIFANAAQTLARTGESVYLSPEGARITTGHIGPFNRGAFHLAASLRAPIVPLFIRIPPEIDPGTGLAARPGVVDVFAGEAIDTRSWQIDEIDRHRHDMHAFYAAWHRRLIPIASS